MHLNEKYGKFLIDTLKYEVSVRWIYLSKDEFVDSLAL
jgi:hypothetical protein